MKPFSCGISAIAKKMTLLAIALIFGASIAFGQTQSNAADLNGTVADPNGAIVAGATVIARNIATNLTRTVTANDSGEYQFIALPPGDYEVTAQAATFKKTVVSPVKLTVGQSADLAVKLELGTQDVVVNVSGADAELVETKTSVSNTIDQQRIENLPINERSATGFALTLSTVGRDNGRPVGPAPTSGLNIGGQRGRSTLVQVDGADFTDNSVNAARSTVSQEAVQEYQVTTNSYLPEFGRATGGIVNVVTKGGTNDVRGNVFGFFRHKSIQARNAFAPIIDGDPNKRPPYTRAQYGATFGAPLVKDKMFVFFSFEQRRRQESGFFTGNIIGRDSSGAATSSVTIGAPFLPISQTYTGLTPAQAAYINANLATNPSSTIAYAQFASTGSQTAQNGASTLVNFLPPPIGVPVGSVIGQRFLLSGAPVPLTRDANGQFLAFRPLSQLAQIFPISEGTTYNSVRFDQLITPTNQFTLRFGYNPSRISGIQDESQNQTLGQNDYSRTGIQRTKDSSVSASLSSVLPRNFVNEAYFTFGRRKATFDSQVPSVAQQIAGTGFIGSNPFSPVNRIETRFQLRDNITSVLGNHTIKFGGDFNWINVTARFDLNFPGLFNFGQQSAGSFVTNFNLTPGAPTATNVACDSPTIAQANRCPALTPVQAYGLGFPSVFIQGFGNPNSKLRNRPIAAFVQDTWKFAKRLTLNYGVRYDIELTDQFAPTPFTDPLTGITLSAADVQTAQDALNITQGFPRDKNNFAPRAGFAYDLFGSGKTVVRGALGMFYDHPLLAVAFNSDIADGSQQQQSTLLPIGGPDPRGLFNAFQVFQGTVCNRGAATSPYCAGFYAANPTASSTLGVAASAQYQYGYQRFDSSAFTGFGPILPFTLHVGKDFQYPYAIQGNFAVEHQIGKDTAISASFITVNARHLAHPQDVNNVDSAALIENFRRFAGRNPNNLTEAAFFSLPTTSSAAFTVLVPGLVVVNAAGQKIVSPIAADYFRKLGPNYFFVASATRGAVNKATFDSLIAGSVRTPGPINPYADVNAQLSDGNSSYNALNVELRKRFSTSFQFLASYTLSHSIDDSSDLQTLLKPQDNLNFREERSDSLFDQRHRFVFSGVLTAPDNWKSSDSLAYRFLSGFVAAPIIEFSSGRPFNILAVGDANGDFQSTNERPTVRADGTLCATNNPAELNCQNGIFPANGNLGRNRGITHNYFSVDMRLTRKVRIGERYSLDFIAEGFNLFNRFNEAAANSDYSVVNAFNQRKGGKYYSEPTSAYDPRQFQFGLKFNF